MNIKIFFQPTQRSTNGRKDGWPLLVLDARFLTVRVVLHRKGTTISWFDVGITLRRAAVPVG